MRKSKSPEIIYVIIKNNVCDKTWQELKDAHKAGKLFIVARYSDGYPGEVDVKYAISYAEPTINALTGVYTFSAVFADTTLTGLELIPHIYQAPEAGDLLAESEEA